MPRIQRRSRLKKTGVVPGSTRWQILMYATPFFEDGSTFENDTEMRTAWKAHRHEMLAACDAGRRPYGYYHFELGIDLVSWKWYDEIRVLLDHNLVDQVEAAAIEALHGALSSRAPVYSEDYFADSSQGILRIVDSGGHASLPRERFHSLDNFQREFELCATWHKWRGRPDFQALYELRAAIVHSVIREKVSK